MKVNSLFLISLALGSHIALIPLILKPRRDPFDAAGSYAIGPLSLILATVVGMAPAFAGAYFGKLSGGLQTHRSEKGQS